MVTLHARGEAGKPPFHGLRTWGKLAYTRGKKLGEGRAGAPGDQALLHRDGLGKRGGRQNLEKRQKTAKIPWKSGRKQRKRLGKTADFY